ncbi:DUF2294 domain-containing protein [Lyngbya sp. PCC 8106]|uniref:DUF2294 domain-containing protein n=1 Tax=Lyngbya sp. (strain PCC 8106) TaxID=313612 RepID=UPI0000EAD0AA|nr:DUF2294 domain-containing protein [Lyngbya sp. PCC 8106]EAW38251.1 hypothetical protein L8106_09516 [Lyngbya sp. PCC 8106]
MKQTNLANAEELICEQIQHIYVQQLEQELSQISCRIFDRILIFVLEGVITPPENLLNQNNHLRLVSQVRSVFDRMIQPKIQDLIEQTLNVTVIDFLCDTTIDTSRTGAIVIFEFQCRRSDLNISDDSNYN